LSKPALAAISRDRELTDQQTIFRDAIVREFFSKKPNNYLSVTESELVELMNRAQAHERAIEGLINNNNERIGVATAG
jgi:hypothetical protein